MIRSSIAKLRATAGRFGADERGAVVILFAMSIVVMVGMIGLSFDLGRQMRVNSELQELADAAALAAARELDGEADAITRADAAARALLNNSAFSENDAQIAQINFTANYNDLTDPTLFLTTDPADQAKAAFVQVLTETGSIGTIFAGVLGGPATMETAARATAGTQYVACAVQPLFMCLPDPSSGITLTEGMMIRVKEQPGSQWGPGNFGILQPPNEGTNQAQITTRIKKNLASSDPDICYVNALLPSQGSKSGPVKEGLNARFDMFDNNPDPVVQIPPGPNNLKGMDKSGANQCVKYNPVTYDFPDGKMPRDNCFADAGGCRGTDSPFGDANWDGQAYWNFHHDETVNPYPGFSTRFAMYMAQLGLNTDGTPTGSGIIPVDGPEDPAPTCSISNGYGGGSVGTWERRVIYAAMIDCVANADWLVGNSAKSPIRNADIGIFFLTEPTEKGQEIFLEYAGRITANDDSGKLQAIVQLYPNPGGLF